MTRCGDSRCRLPIHVHPNGQPWVAEPPERLRPTRRQKVVAFAFVVLFVLACSLVPGGGLP